uniref:AAA family ATPase n=3 Tax=Succinivibrio sp. TaxID=2053619 RepID=UPI003FEF00A5
MGYYLNPSSPRYEKLKKSKVFVDKTDIFEILNENLGKEKSFFCLSRPRCFGKSVTAQMICSYYARCQDSSSLFDNLKIASFDDYKKHLNQHDVAFNQMQQWYDGYSFKDVPHIYNPNSVVNAATYKKYISYRTKTETFESLQEYIDMNMEGLRDDIVKLIAGEAVIIDVSTFSNDMVTFHSKDDVLTLLIHLGYLAIKGSTNLGVIVHIPNEEIKLEFKTCVKNNNRYAGVYDLIKNTDVLLNDIWSLNSEAVAKIFDEAHQDHTSILTYNNENSLANVIAISLFLSTTNTYNVVRELPTGKGYADLVYLPKSGVNKPALLIELKFDKSALTAITQIKEKNYLLFFKDYKGEVLLVGINYSKDTKTHQCIIERAKLD